MRIIAGEFKGRNLLGPKSIRPTEDKVKKSLFDIFREPVLDSRFLDLFAGSGAVGIEALSRGAREVYFVENNFNACKIIEQNISKLRLKEQTYKILSMDVERAILHFHKAKEVFDLVYLDPPYYQDMAKKALQMLSSYDILGQNGFVIVQHHSKDRLEQESDKLKLWRTRSYSTTLLSFYSKITNL
ncbi:MAG: 16S rRNA (guanine(966)-N(2))-methyltransferase RsmD [Candidatus Omnitrophica bacterium]|nr:16S rRNA (guanine(966)-N(2))-methyltransferase RsmD [Candidatus Omnitrophota bacterium]